MKTEIQQPERDQEVRECHQDSQAESIEVYKPRKWPAVAIFSTSAVIGLGGLAWLLWASATAEITNPIGFITTGCLSLFLIVVAIAQFGLYWSQRDFMNAQWNAMERTLRAIGNQEKHLSSQAKAAEAQATTMGQQLEAMKDQSEKMGLSIVLSNRASVGIHSIEYDRATQVIFVKVENIGLVPAKSIVLFLEVVIRIPANYVSGEKGPTSIRQFLKYRIGEKNYGDTHLLRGNLQITRTFNLGGRLREGEADLIHAGRAKMVVHGRVSYGDGFEGQKRQETDFLFFYDAKHNFWTADDPQAWRAVFREMGVADNEKEDSEIGPDYIEI
jgi:hypothetical protein